MTSGARPRAVPRAPICPVGNTGTGWAYLPPRGDRVGGSPGTDRRSAGTCWTASTTGAKLLGVVADQALASRSPPQAWRQERARAAARWPYVERRSGRRPGARRDAARRARSVGRVGATEARSDRARPRAGRRRPASRSRGGTGSASTARRRSISTDRGVGRADVDVGHAQLGRLTVVPRRHLEASAADQAQSGQVWRSGLLGRAPGRRSTPERFAPAVGAQASTFSADGRRPAAGSASFRP
jgi:hypothetical protein